MNSRILDATAIAFFGATLCATPGARADIAPDPMSGGISLETPGTTKTSIVLTHNTVQLKIAPNLCRTRAWFRLHNTGAATFLRVGFPLMYQGEAADFKVWIDGQPQIFNDRVWTGKVQAGPMIKTVTRRWKVWPMTFEADETHLVEVRYSNAPSEGFSYTLQNGSYPTADFPRREGRELYDAGDFGYPQRVGISEWTTMKTVQYILISGSYWKGAIGRCRVEADISDLPTDGITDVLPPAQSFSARQIVWEWKNVEPDRNIRIDFVGASPRRTVIPTLEKIAAKYPQDQTVRDSLQQMKKDFPDAATIRKRQSQFVQPPRKRSGSE